MRMKQLKDAHAQALAAMQKQLETNEKNKADEISVLKNQLEKERERAQSHEQEMQRVDEELKRLQASGDKDEELRVMKISYEKMISAKDKEIAEAEERLREAMASSKANAVSSEEIAARVEVGRSIHTFFACLTLLTTYICVPGRSTE